MSTKVFDPTGDRPLSRYRDWLNLSGVLCRDSACMKAATQLRMACGCDAAWLSAGTAVMAAEITRVLMNVWVMVSAPDEWGTRADLSRAAARQQTIKSSASSNGAQLRRRFGVRRTREPTRSTKLLQHPANQRANAQSLRIIGPCHEVVTLPGRELLREDTHQRARRETLRGHGCRHERDADALFGRVNDR